MRLGTPGLIIYWFALSLAYAPNIDTELGLHSVLREARHVGTDHPTESRSARPTSALPVCLEPRVRPALGTKLLSTCVQPAYGPPISALPVCVRRDPRILQCCVRPRVRPRRTPGQAPRSYRLAFSLAYGPAPMILQCRVRPRVRPANLGPTSLPSASATRARTAPPTTVLRSASRTAEVHVGTEPYPIAFSRE